MLMTVGLTEFAQRKRQWDRRYEVEKARFHKFLERTLNLRYNCNGLS